MDSEQLEAARSLIEFARDHAMEVYGAQSDNAHTLLEEAETLESYLDS